MTLDRRSREIVWLAVASCSAIGGLSLVTAAEFPPTATAEDVPRLLRSTELVRRLSREELMAWVPQQSGLLYVGCPNCQGGRQERQLEWDPERPAELHCRYCRHVYPSQQYPMRDTLTVQTPDGKTAHYPYWTDTRGYRFFFAAHRDDCVKEYLAERTRELALLAVLTGERPYAERAAWLLERFAQVFPGWCFHYDYPFQQKEIYSGPVAPAQYRPGYRTARWTWWAYSDIPVELVEAFDWLRDTGALDALSRERGSDVARQIERDLLRAAADQVLANPEPYTNMSPTAWRGLIRTGRVLREPKYVHEPLRRMRTLVADKFFYDGSWYEGSPDYASQTLGGLEEVLAVARGYSDPPGYTDPVDGTHWNQLDLAREFPEIEQARQTWRQWRLPNGRAVPMHDTWPSGSRRGRTPGGGTYLLPALGHACLASGMGVDQTQVHLTWSGGYGHDHADNLSLLLYAGSREMLSDLGYTHTAYRAWTLATAAHNTVVIDGRSQAFGGLQSPSDGTLLHFLPPRPESPGFVQADGSRGYPGLAQLYRRSLLLVGGDQHPEYLVDCFEVTGGRRHDYFLHGDADGPSQLETSVPLTSRGSLLPEGYEWRPPRNEGEARRAAIPHDAYGFLRNLRSASLTEDRPVSATFRHREAEATSTLVTLVPEVGSELILGDNPSIRRAEENDAELERHLRPFLLLRRQAAGAEETLSSRFATVIEPATSKPRVARVTRVPIAGAVLVLTLTYEDRLDGIVLGAESQPIEFRLGEQTVRFQGEAGWLSLRGAAVVQALALGQGGWDCGEFHLRSTGRSRVPLLAVARDILVIPAETAGVPSAGEVIRVVTEDGWVYPYRLAAVVKSENCWRLQVQQGAGMAWDPSARKLRLTRFPQRQHSGTVQVDWTKPARYPNTQENSR